MAEQPDSGLTTGTPLWVKIFGTIIMLLALLFVMLLLFGGGRHGPGRHLPSGEPGSRTPPIEHGEKKP